MKYCGVFMDTDIGEILVLTNAEGVLRQIHFCRGRDHQTIIDRFAEKEIIFSQDPGPTAEVVNQLRAYFRKDLTQFDLPFETGGTAFQREVWSALLHIPYGECVSYKDIAEQIGRPKAVRAVGLANGSNPISIVIPCHRVIGTSGKLTGYGGGIENKAWLLRHEGYLML